MDQCANARNVSFIYLFIIFFLGGGGGGGGGWGVNVTFFLFFNQIFSTPQKSGLQVAGYFALILRSVWISDKTLCLLIDLASQTEKLAKKLWHLISRNGVISHFISIHFEEAGSQK